MNFLKVVCVFLLAGFPAGAALRCYQCLNVETSSGALTGKENRHCDAHGFDSDSVDKVSCGSGMQCAYYTAKVKETAPEDVTVKLDVRGCFPDTGSNGCKSGSKDQMDHANELSSLYNGGTIKDFYGCICSEDLCNGGRSLRVSVIVFLGVAVAVVLPALL